MKILSFLLVLLASLNLYSQSVRITNIDASNYPEVLVEVQAYQANSDQFRELSPASMTITDGGVSKVIRSVECEEDKVRFSLVVQMDRSASMKYGINDNSDAPVGQRRWDAILEALEEIVDNLSPSQTEFALHTFSSGTEVVQDFTQDFNLAKAEINELYDAALLPGTDFNVATIGLRRDYVFIGPGPGAIPYTRNARWKPVVIIFTDGEHNKTTPDDVRTDAITDSIFALEEQPLVYAMTYGTNSSTQLSTITSVSGGQSYANFTGKDQIVDVFNTIIEEVEDNPAALPPCEVLFDANCDGGLVIVDVNINGTVYSDTMAYTIPNEVAPNLEVSNRQPVILDAPEGGTKTIDVQITARNNFITFSGPPTFDDDRFSVVNWNGARLNKDQTRTVTIQYEADTQKDCITSNMSFQSSACSGNDMTPKAGFVVVRNVAMPATTVGVPVEANRIAFCNNTCRDVTLDDITFNDRDAADFEYIGPRGVTIAAGECRELAFRFTPSSDGDKSADMLINIDQKVYLADITGGSTGLPEIASTLTGNNPELDCLGDQQNITVTITNDGPVALTVDNTSYSNTTDFSEVSGVTTVAAGGSEDIIVRFNPQTPGPKTCEITITSDADNEPSHVVTINGNLRNHAFAPVDNSYDFGVICPSEDGNISIEFNNTGDTDNSLILSSANGDISFPTGTTLALPNGAMNESIDVVVNSATDQNFNETITVTDECGNTENVTITGIIQVPTIDRADARVISGNLNTALSDNFDIANNSNHDLSNITYNVLGPDAADFTVNGPANLAAGEAANITIDFTITPTTGASIDVQVQGDPSCLDNIMTFDINPGVATADFSVGQYAQIIGKTISVDVDFVNKNGFDEAGVQTVTAEIRVNRYLLENTDGSIVSTLDGDDLVLYPVLDAQNPQAIEFLVLDGNDQTITTTPITVSFDVSEPAGVVDVAQSIGQFDLIQSSARWELNDLEARPGQNVELEIGLRDLQNVELFHGSITGELEFNASLISPIDDTPEGTINNVSGLRYIPFEIPITDPMINNDGLSEVSAGPLVYRFKAMLGNSESTEIRIVNASTINGEVSIPDTEFSTFSLQDVCRNEAGEIVRLFDPTFNAAAIDLDGSNLIQQTTTFNFSVLESGMHRIRLIDLNGNVVAQPVYGNYNTGIYQAMIDPSNIPNGSYIMILETPTQIISENIRVMK